MPVEGFQVPPEHLTKFRIMPRRWTPIPRSALKTRRGTGYYKVPSLKGVWYRGTFGHDGSCATLEDWFDPARLRDDYVPTVSTATGSKGGPCLVTSSGSVCRQTRREPSSRT